DRRRRPVPDPRRRGLRAPPLRPPPGWGAERQRPSPQPRRRVHGVHRPRPARRRRRHRRPVPRQRHGPRVPERLMADAALPALPATTPITHRDGPLVRNARAVVMVWVRDLIRLKRTPTRIVTGIAQPLLFLFVLVAELHHLIGTQRAGGVDYQQYLFPGILAMSVLTSALFSAIAIVWDREFGFMREMLVAPVSRSSIVFGKALGGGSVAVVQGIILVVVAPLVGVDLTVGRFFAMLGFLLLLAFALTAFGIVIASR